VGLVAVIVGVVTIALSPLIRRLMRAAHPDLDPTRNDSPH